MTYTKHSKENDSFLDHSEAVGWRYGRLDGVGAPFAITIDHQTLQDGTVTLMDRDSMNKIELKFLK